MSQARLLSAALLWELCNRRMALAAWAYLVYLALEMGTMDEKGAMSMAPDMVMPHMQSWGAIELLLLFVISARPAL